MVISRRYFLTNAEIDEARGDGHRWHEMVRRREFEMLMEHLGRPSFDHALELGAGDGGQSVTIARYCRRLTCTELSETGNTAIGRFHARAVPNAEYLLCDARDLSRFADSAFDLVFSSNMLEHVEEVGRCLAECRRVLRPGGWMIHVMPGRVWKFFSYTVNWFLHGRAPGVHGIDRGHLAEFRRFGVRSWLRTFRAAGIEIADIVGLPFYVGHGNRCIPLIKLGNALRRSAAWAYFARGG